MEQIINHVHCDTSTVRLIYWSIDPEYIYSNFGSLDSAINSGNDLAVDTAKLLQKIEDKISKNLFIHTLSSVPLHLKSIDF